MQTDIAGTEILANCQLLRMPRSQWPDITWRIGILVSVAAPILNRDK